MMAANERASLSACIPKGGMIRHGYIGRRGWIFTRRHYSPGGWRVPKIVHDRCWQYDASGKSMVIHLSYLHGIPQACRRFVRLIRSDAACAECYAYERPWRRLMAYPLGSAWAFVCSDACWDALDARRYEDDDDA